MKGIEEESRGIKLISKGPTPFCNTESFMRVKAREFEFRDTKNGVGKSRKERMAIEEEMDASQQSVDERKGMGRGSLISLIRETNADSSNYSRLLPCRIQRPLQSDCK